MIKGENNDNRSESNFRRIKVSYGIKEQFIFFLRYICVGSFSFSCVYIIRTIDASPKL